MPGQEGGGIGFPGEQAEPFSQMAIEGNSIYVNEPADSETLVPNGDVTDQAITSSLLVDSNDIGIDLIGGEPVAGSP
jgi:hypothetical protein